MVENRAPVSGHQKIKKPFYNQWWFWTIVSIFVIASVAHANVLSTSSTAWTILAMLVISSFFVGNDSSNLTVDWTPAMPAWVPSSQNNAIQAAKSYLSAGSFSHDGLVARLEHDQFTHADAVYGADHFGVDWNNQAVETARNYLSSGSFSHDELVAQLVFEQFTPAQAEYGADHSRADWNDLAALAIGDRRLGGKIAYLDGTGQHGLIAAPWDQDDAEWNSAIRLCANLTLNGYNDWYLPNKDELNQLYLNQAAIGGFASAHMAASAYYWSSSENSTSNAWARSFDDGSQLDYFKSACCYVRAVRAF